MEKKIFEYYCPNVEMHGRSDIRVEYWNIFNNYYVYEWTLRAVKKYLRAPSKYCYKSFGENVEPIYGFEALCKELEMIFAHEFRARYQYEFSIGEPFPLNDDKTVRSELFKEDLFWLIKPNIPIIANSCILQYKIYLKNKTAYSE